jgi:hypothetical protein
MHFVRGYVDGDGSARKGGWHTEDGILTIVGTGAFLEGLRQTIRLATGATGGLTHHCRGIVMYLRYSWQFQSWAVADWPYSGATVCLERKHAAAAAFSRGKRKGYPTARRHVGTAGNVSSGTIRTYSEVQKGM